MRYGIGALAVLGLLVGAGPAAVDARAQVCAPVVGDLDGDRDVDADDGTIWLECARSGGPGCEGADLDLDGDVDRDDGRALRERYTGPTFDYGASPRPDAEAEILAFELTGALLAPDPEYERISRDLARIREHSPELETFRYVGRWVDGQMLVALIDEAPTEGYDARNAYLKLCDSDFLFGFGGTSWYNLTFEGRPNVEALAARYATLPEVDSAEPNYLIGLDDFVTVTRRGEPGAEVFTYDLDDGFTDCFDGCDCHRLYVFEVDADGTVERISFVEQGLPWCDFGTS